MSLRPRYVRTMQLLAGLVCIAISAANLGAQTPTDAEKSSAKVLTPESVILNLPLAPGEAPLPITLRQMMSIYRVPGMSIAVVDHFNVAWAEGYGVTAAGGSTPVTPKTLFQAASISKPVTAAGGLWLVEHGKLSLDEDVNRKLSAWKVPENEFTTQEKVTLRRLMSHNAGLNVHGFAGYAKDAPLPTIQQTLNGLPPANNQPIRVTIVPGSQCVYSGGGVTVEGLLIRDVSGQSFEQFMADHVLLPAGMKDSTFEQHLSAAMASRAAQGTRANGEPVAGGWHLYPELAPDGLWTTPSDLAKYAIEIALSEQGKANHILSASMAREMLTPQCHDAPGDPGGIGLGFGVGYNGHPNLFRHTGGNDGFESLLVMDARIGFGVALTGNSDNFQFIYPDIAETIAKEYGYQLPAEPIALRERLILIAAIKGIGPALDTYKRAKAEDGKRVASSSEPLNALGYYLLGSHKMDDAIKVFRMNVTEYPQDPNTYDSLAEAYMDRGDREDAIRNYQMSLKLNPQNTNAVQKLQQLGVH